MQPANHFLAKFGVVTCPMNLEFCEHNSRDIDSLIAQQINPFDTSVYAKWRHAWQVGEDLRTIPVAEHDDVMEEAFGESNGPLKMLCEFQGVSYKVSQEWALFEKAVKLGLGKY